MAIALEVGAWWLARESPAVAKRALFPVVAVAIMAVLTVGAWRVGENAPAPIPKSIIDIDIDCIKR
jgi:hypothetical protein